MKRHRKSKSNGVERPPVSLPPRWADKLLAWYCAPHLLEEVQGDLHEEYAWQVQRVGRRRAKFDYVRNVLGFVRPFAVKRKSNNYPSPSFLNTSMLRNNLTITLRNLLRNPVVTGIHVVGLTLGLTTCLLIGLFIRHEWGYDRYHPQGDRIYRVALVEKSPEHTEYSGITPYPLPAALRNDFADWPFVAGIHETESEVVALSPDKILREKAILFAEPALLDLFQIELVTGNGRAILGTPNQVILSETTARNYYGPASPIGKTFRLGNSTTLQVAGIMRDMPAQSHLRANMIVSYASLKSYYPLFLTQWGSRSAGSVYALLPPGQTPSRYAGRLKQASRKYFEPEGGPARELVLQPLHDIHFNPEFGGSVLSPAISPTYLWVFGTIGLFVLMIACVNFVNMATARAATRAKEVGVRKVIGATGKQLIGLFLGEAAGLVLFSAAFALLLTYSLLPALNSLMQKQIAFRPAEVLAALGLLALFTTLLAGLYPSVVMARFKPVSALKARVYAEGGKVAWLRQGLVVFQFAASLVLVVGVLVIYKQMEMFRHKSLGFNRNAIVTVDIPDPGKTRFATLRESLQRIAGVEEVSFALDPPGTGDNFGTTMSPDPSKPDRQTDIALKIADADYLRTYGIELLAGRFLTHHDTLAIAESVPREQKRYVFVVNEKLTKILGYARSDQALGRKIRIGINDIEAEIVGVVKDFHTSSLHEEVQPVVIMNFPYFYATAGLKLRTANYPATLAAVEQVWRQFNPNSFFEAKFLDQRLQGLYQEEARQFALLRIFAGLALVICCLGLWGLATFTIGRRTKEIGIRKVLGASVTGIVALLSRDFLRLVVVAILIASPPAWYLMQKWLETFAYRTGLDWWIFALAGALAAGVALLTVSFQSIKAALMNPVKSLRNE